MKGSCFDTFKHGKGNTIREETGRFWLMQLNLENIVILEPEHTATIEATRKDSKMMLTLNPWLVKFEASTEQ